MGDKAQLQEGTNDERIIPVDIDFTLAQEQHGEMKKTRTANDKGVDKKGIFRYHRTDSTRRPLR